jgi:hypothetical protein
MGVGSTLADVIPAASVLVRSEGRDIDDPLDACNDARIE